MDATNQDDEAMTAMMGIAGFGSTKVCVLPRTNIPASEKVL